MRACGCSRPPGRGRTGTSRCEAATTSSSGARRQALPSPCGSGPASQRSLALPMIDDPAARSLNLGNAVCVAVYEGLRQLAVA